MDISSTAEFAANPEQVFAMMIDVDYLEKVCEASHALRYDASADGNRTRSSRTLSSPASAARFTGPELTVVEEIVWGANAPDGSRTGALTMAVTGQPVTLTGQMRITPGGPGTVLTLAGDLKVAIPLFGKKLEQSSAPAILAGFRTHQQVGTDWLAR